MHQKTHTFQQGVEQHGSMLFDHKHDTVCIDGVCREREMVRMHPEQPPTPEMVIETPRGVVLMLPSQRMNPFLAMRRMPMPPAVAMEMPCPEEELKAAQVGPLMDLAPPSVVPRPGPAQVEINKPAFIACVSLAAAALALGTITVLRVMMQGSAPVVEDRPFTDMAVPLAAAGESAAVPLPAPAVRKAAQVEQATEEPAPAPAAEPEVAFNFKPSVGTWLAVRQ